MNIFFPISINITNKQILIIGGGLVAFHKATVLSHFTSKIIVIAPEFCSKFELLSLKLKKKKYELEDLTDIFLVYICTEKQSLNQRIKIDCENRNILANVCNNSKLCDFISPAIYKNNNVTISVSSNAQKVQMSIDIRNQIKSLVEKDILKIKINN